MRSSIGVKYDDFFSVLKRVIKEIIMNDDYKSKFNRIERYAYLKPILIQAINNRVIYLKRNKIDRKINLNSIKDNVTRRINKDLDIIKFCDMVIDLIETGDDSALKTILLENIKTDKYKKVFLIKIDEGLKEVKKLLGRK